MAKVLSGILVIVWTVVSAGWCADGGCCRRGQEGPAMRGKVAPLLDCQLELVGQPKADQIQHVRLSVQNRFHSGTLRIRLRIPEPLRPDDELKQPSPQSLALGEEKQVLLPVVVPVEGQHRLEAVVSLDTPEGSKVSSSAFLMVGVPQPKATRASVVEATRPNGQRLRIHRISPSNPNLEKDH